jgi:hypothetical protein
MSNFNVGFVTFPDVTQLDFAGPFEVIMVSRRTPPRKSPGGNGWNERCALVVLMLAPGDLSPKYTRPIASARRCRHRCSVPSFRSNDAPRAAGRHVSCNQNDGRYGRRE